MSTLADRLRGIVAAIPASRPPVPASRRDDMGLDDIERGNAQADPVKVSRTREMAADVLDGEWVAASGGQVLVRTAATLDTHWPGLRPVMRR